MSPRGPQLSVFDLFRRSSLTVFWPTAVPLGESILSNSGRLVWGNLCRDTELDVGRLDSWKVTLAYS